jgi:hypothetical protein
MLDLLRERVPAPMSEPSVPDGVSAITPEKPLKIQFWSFFALGTKMEISARALASAHPEMKIWNDGR